jgi:hypothetical protein
LHPLQHLLLVVFLMIAIQTRVRWNLSVVLICISFMPRDAEHFSCAFWSFEFLPLEKICLVHLPTSLLVHLYLEREFSFLNSVYYDYQSFVWWVAGKWSFWYVVGFSLPLYFDDFCIDVH